MSHRLFPLEDDGYPQQSDETSGGFVNSGEATMTVTLGLIGVNVVVFILMLVTGVSPLSPLVKDLIHWGADYGPLTTHGQWWRLLTAAFVHIGIIHLAMNMYVLAIIGPVTEKLFGAAGFAALYLLAGIGGNIVSLAWHPFTTAAGASGAVFGLYGGIFGYLLLQRNSVAPEKIEALLRSGAGFLVFNLLFGFAKENVDVAAHLGGLATGFVAGCALARPVPAVMASAGFRRSMVVLVAGTVLAVAGASRIPKSDDLLTEVQRFGQVESRVVPIFEQVWKESLGHSISNEQFQQELDQKVLLPWNSERTRFARLKFGKDQQPLADLLMKYMDLRAEGWTLSEKSVLTHNRDLARTAFMKQVEATGVIREIAKIRKK